MTTPDRDALLARQQQLRDAYLLPPPRRPATTANGLHHAALICSDPERTIGFYQGMLGFPLVELVENRDYPGSTHFFFDLGNRTLLGFFDFPGLGLQPGVEALGGVQHLAISVEPETFDVLRKRLDDAGVAYAGGDERIPNSVYFKDPDGIQVELLREPLGIFEGKHLFGTD